MKHLITIALLFLGLGFSSCDKETDSDQQQIEEIRIAKTSQCGTDSDKISSVYLPIDSDEETKRLFFEMALAAVHSGETYMQINETSGEMVISVFRFSASFPYDAPQPGRTIYQGKDKGKAAMAGALAQMNYQCLPVVVFNWDGDWIVEDCC